MFQALCVENSQENNPEMFKVENFIIKQNSIISDFSSKTRGHQEAKMLTFVEWQKNYQFDIPWYIFSM